MKETVLANM